MRYILSGRRIKDNAGRNTTSAFLFSALVHIRRTLKCSKRSCHIRLTSDFVVSTSGTRTIRPGCARGTSPAGHPCLGRKVILGFGTGRGCYASTMSTTVFHSLYGQTSIPIRAFAGHSSVTNNSALKGVSGARITLGAISVKLPRLTVRSPCRATNIGSARCLMQTTGRFFY